VKVISENDRDAASHVFGFHQATICHCCFIDKLCEDLIAQRLEVKEARERINRALYRLQCLNANIDVHYWLGCAFAMQNPGKSSNRLFFSHHAEALKATSFFLEHFVDFPRTDSEGPPNVVREDELFTVPNGFKLYAGIKLLSGAATPNEVELDSVMPLFPSLCVALDLDRVTRNAIHYRRALPVLDDNFLGTLESESDLACALLMEEKYQEGQTQPMAVGLPKLSKLETSQHRNSTPGSADAKIVAALCLHHKYEKGSCMNMEPIVGNKLATDAEVATGSVTAFWKRHFGTGDRDGSYEEYRRACNNDTIPIKLAVLSGEPPTKEALELLVDHFAGKRKKDDD
jgi:hypothetical protein